MVKLRNRNVISASHSCGVRGINSATWATRRKGPRRSVPPSRALSHPQHDKHARSYELAQLFYGHLDALKPFSERYSHFKKAICERARGPFRIDGMRECPAAGIFDIASRCR